jgi:hypothetical protein
VTLELGRARVRKDRNDVAKDRRVAVAVFMLRPIDEAGSLIIALVVAAMLQRGERIEMLLRISKILTKKACLLGSLGRGLLDKKFWGDKIPSTSTSKISKSSVGGIH